MKRCILHIFFFVVCTGVFSAQSKRSVSFESGAVISKPFIKQEHFGQENWTSDYYYNYTYYTAIGSFAKLSLDLRSKPKNNWAFTYPISISYMKQITSLYRKGWYSGCFVSEMIDEKNTFSNSNLISSFGLGVQYQNLKVRQSINLSINNTFTFRSTLATDKFNGGTISETKNNSKAFTMNLGGQYFALFNIRKNIWLGPSCEVYYYRAGALISEVSQKIHHSEYLYKRWWANTGLNGNYIWINTGLKLQIDLK